MECPSSNACFTISQAGNATFAGDVTSAGTLTTTTANSSQTANSLFSLSNNYTYLVGGSAGLVVKDKVNGLLVKTEQEWVDALEALIKDAKKRKEFGKRGREIFELNYSTGVIKNKYLSVLKQI